MFLPPKYRCDACGSEQAAEWTGLPNWDVSLGWAEHYNPNGENKHYCKSCMKQCGCGQCGGLPTWECMSQTRGDS